MSENKTYSTLSVYPELIGRIVQLKKDVGLKNNSQAVQVLLTAFDIINSTRYGEGFTEAVKQIMEVE